MFFLEKSERLILNALSHVSSYQLVAAINDPLQKLLIYSHSCFPIYHQDNPRSSIAKNLVCRQGFLKVPLSEVSVYLLRKS